MENTKVLKAMQNYVETSGMNWEKVEKACCSSWSDANEWSEILGMSITPQRLASMFRAGLVVRNKDKQFFGDNNYRYFPIMRG